MRKPLHELADTADTPATDAAVEQSQMRRHTVDVQEALARTVLGLGHADGDNYGDECAAMRGLVKLLAEAIATRQVGPVRLALEWMDRLIERDGRENSEYHAPIGEIGRTVARYHDEVGLTRLMKLTAGANSGDAA